MSLAFLVALLEVGHEDNLKGDTMSAMVMLSHTHHDTDISKRNRQLPCSARGLSLGFFMKPGSSSIR